MQNVQIKRPAAITEGQAMNAVFDAFRQVWRNVEARAEMLKGVSQSVKVGGFEVSVFAWRDGRIQANVYAGGFNPVATAEVDEFDA
ncbi:hypothetical protein S3_048 [Pseudomonas phage vB_PaeS_SCUT-S3]|uniref:Uncharacterized protein n=1 Tax=Pseudomonas phage vB_PaeS_SCUT-S3 TaxID=2382122 RepID=A0A3S8G622_9CAUD|nr:hypothetical protein P7H99_gp48 [Pseudomonas phage vB_PaeS_SCUT-S3]AZF90053.1 hypothetical protein S3_048 [Pseudomonas phage vB_PaeS_SCUT-S3]AZF90113.1 hypothetical protein S4_046 [Pseudomonas phage vB_PaeS_SCUT-S4]